MWHDAAGALDKVHAQLEKLLEQQRAKRAELEKLAEAKAAEVPEVDKEEESHPEPLPQVARNVAQTAPTEETTDSTTHDIFGQNLFVEADLTEAVEKVDPDAFLDTEYDATLNAMIAHIINIEGPIREDVLAKRIARAHGWARTGKRIRDRVYLLAEDYPTTTEEVGLFFWPQGSDTTQWPHFRYSENGVRPVDEICIQELRALTLEIGNQGDSDDARIAKMAGLIGIRRVTGDVRGRFKKCFGVTNS